MEMEMEMEMEMGIKGRHYQNDNDRNFNKNDGFSSEIKINSHGLVSVSLTYKDARALAIRNNIVGYQSLPQV